MNESNIAVSWRVIFASWHLNSMHTLLTPNDYSPYFIESFLFNFFVAINTIPGYARQ